MGEQIEKAKQRLFETCERKGEAEVRLWLADLLTQSSQQARYTREWVREWLAPYDAAERERAQGARAESLDLARSGTDAAWVSANAAKEAASSARTSNAIATFSLVVSVIAIAVAVIAIFARP